MKKRVRKPVCNKVLIAVPCFQNQVSVCQCPIQLVIGIDETPERKQADHQDNGKTDAGYRGHLLFGKPIQQKSNDDYHQQRQNNSLADCHSVVSRYTETCADRAEILKNKRFITELQLEVIANGRR